MDQNQPYLPAPNPYDFITNPGKPSKKPGLSGPSSMKGRLLIVGGGAVILLMLVMIVTTLLNAAGQAPTKALKDLVTDQQEIARVAALGAKDAHSSSTRALAITTQTSLATDQQKLIGYLEEKGTKLSKEELAAKVDNDTDKALELAATNNRYDEVFTEHIKKMLAAYANKLQTAYKENDNQTVKKLLEESFNSASHLLGPPKTATQ